MSTASPDILFAVRAGENSVRRHNRKIASLTRNDAGIQTKKDLVNFALRELIRRKERKKILG
jgi:Bacterial antitoxin of type II TA system, VapB